MHDLGASARAAGEKAARAIASLAPLFVLAAAPTHAQPTAPTPLAVVSPQVLADHRVVFRQYAPKATEVTLAGSFWLQEGRTERMVRDALGLWSFTTEPLPADYFHEWPWFRRYFSEFAQVAFR